MQHPEHFLKHIKEEEEEEQTNNNNNNTHPAMPVNYNIFVFIRLGGLAGILCVYRVGGKGEVRAFVRSCVCVCVCVCV